jgi:hypothetical protein
MQQLCASLEAFWHQTAMAVCMCIHILLNITLVGSTYGSGGQANSKMILNFNVVHRPTEKYNNDPVHITVAGFVLTSSLT